MKQIRVEKADGLIEGFQMSKLRGSLKKAGASYEEVAIITRDIENLIYDGIKTDEIYRRAFELLRHSGKTVAARYSLRRAMVGLGPTGFPFEDYLARLYASEGYRTQSRVQIKGKCVTHEVDMVAYRPGECIVAEAKFHMQPGMKSDLQVILYSHARFNDIAGARVRRAGGSPVTHSLVATNTKFTTMATKYAVCAGIDLLSWDYPKKGNLHDMIERSKLYPITILQTLTMNDKKALLEKGVVLCNDVIDNHSILSSVGIPRKKMSAIMDEGARLCPIK